MHIPLKQIEKNCYPREEALMADLTPMSPELSAEARMDRLR